MTEHIELVFILQNRIEEGIVYFFLTDYIQSKFAVNIGVPRYYLDFLIRVKLEFLYFIWDPKLSWCIYSKTD